MLALRMFHISKRFSLSSSNLCINYSAMSSKQSSLLRHNVVLKPVPACNFSTDFIFPIVSSIIKNILKFCRKSENYKNCEQRVGDKDVYLLKNHIKSHPVVQRNALVNQLLKTVPDATTKYVKVVYVYGLPGIGKKELVRQFAKQHYEKLQSKKAPKKFVAIIRASDPHSFHHDLFKIAEQADVIENFEQYTEKTKKLKDT